MRWRLFPEGLWDVYRLFSRDLAAVEGQQADELNELYWRKMLAEVLPKVQGTPLMFNQLHGNATKPLIALIAWVMNGDPRSGPEATG